MVRLIILFVIIFLIPSGIVAARMLYKYLSFKLQVLKEDREHLRLERSQQTLNKVLTAGNDDDEIKPKRRTGVMSN